MLLRCFLRAVVRQNAFAAGAPLRAPLGELIQRSTRPLSWNWKKGVGKGREGKGREGKGSSNLQTKKSGYGLRMARLVMVGLEIYTL